MPKSVTPPAIDKEVALVEWLKSRGSVLIGFSGGVDSAYLACVALGALGSANVLAVIGRSASYPIEQWTRAREVADCFSVPVLEIDTDELHDPRYAANPSNRCYFCKTELWSRLVPVARERGLAVVVDVRARARLWSRACGRRSRSLASPRMKFARCRESAASRRGRSRLRPVSRRACRMELKSRSNG